MPIYDDHSCLCVARVWYCGRGHDQGRVRAVKVSDQCNANVISTALAWWMVLDVSGPQEALKDVAQLSGLSAWPVGQVDVLTERELVAPVPFALAVEAHARGTTTLHRSESHVAVAFLSVLHRRALTNSDSFSMNPQTTDHVCQFADMRGLGGMPKIGHNAGHPIRGQRRHKIPDRGMRSSRTVKQVDCKKVGANCICLQTQPLPLHSCSLNATGVYGQQDHYI